MAVVQFFFHDRKPMLKERRRLRSFIVELFKKEKSGLLKLAYIFCSDQYLLSLNKEFLRHDFYTDIITFDLSEITGQITGEIYISTDRVRDNATTLGVNIKEELHRVIFHGALHLCGYKDKTSKAIKLMRQKEDYYLASYRKACFHVKKQSV